MSRVNAGKLDKLVSFESPSEGTPGAYGSVPRTWAEYHAARCSIRTAPGGERYSGDQVVSDATHVIETHYSSEMAVTVPRNRAVWDSRTFELLSVTNVDEANVMLSMTAKETTGAK